MDASRAIAITRCGNSLLPLRVAIEESMKGARAGEVNGELRADEIDSMTVWSRESADPWLRDEVRVWDVE